MIVNEDNHKTWLGTEKNSFYIHMPSLFKDISDKEFEELYALHPQQVGQVMMFGKKVNTPRYQQSYGVPYQFSGMNHEALPFPDNETLKRLKKYVEDKEGCEYAQMLINWYDNGDHYIGKHSDDEKQIVPGSSIYSFSLGSDDRIFRIRAKHESTPGIKCYIDLEMPHGTLIIMGGEMQKHYTHEVPKSKKIKDRRINVTFRRFIK